MSHLTQMAGLTVQNFVSAAVGIAVAAALIRGLVRRRSVTIGNFWVDLTRITTRVLLPLVDRRWRWCSSARASCSRFAEVSHATTVQGARSRSSADRSRARRRSRSSARTAAASSTRTRRIRSRTRPASRTCSRSGRCSAIPFALDLRLRPARRATSGRGGPCSRRCSCSGSASAGLATDFELGGNPRVEALGVTSDGGNMEGKEVRFGAAASGLFAASTTGTSTGAVNSAHDSFTPLGGARAAREHDARRGLPGRRRRRPLRDPRSSRCSRCSSPA